MVLPKTVKEKKLREYYVHVYSSYVPSDKYYLLLETNIIEAKKVARILSRMNYKNTKGRAESSDNFQFQKKYGFNVKPYNPDIHEPKEDLIIIPKDYLK